MDFGLKESVVNAVCNLFAKFPQIEKAVIYGSRAKGNYKEGSDIDLSLYGPLLNSDIINKLNIELDDLMLPYTFDLSIYDKISNTQLKEHIYRVGRLFYQKKV
jgi:uncharacterized protein